MRYQKHIAVFFILLVFFAIAIEKNVWGGDGMRMISKQKTNFNRPRVTTPPTEKTIDEFTKNFDAAKITQQPQIISKMTEPRLAIKIPSDIIVENANAIPAQYYQSSLQPQNLPVSKISHTPSNPSQKNILKMIVQGEDDLTGQYKISNDNIVSLPLIGAVNINPFDIDRATKIITKKYKNGYLKKPKISLELINDQPFFILGEVNQPGSYQYRSGLTMEQAVALAGGYTRVAKKGSADAWRDSAPYNKSFQIALFDTVEAGDIIFVRERSF